MLATIDTLATSDAIRVGNSTVHLWWFLLLGAVLFAIGTMGVLIRRNPLVTLLCIELMLNAVFLTLVAFSRFEAGMEGQVFALLSMTVAAAEVVIGLGLLVDIFHMRAVDVDDLTEMKN